MCRSLLQVTYNWSGFLEDMSSRTRVEDDEIACREESQILAYSDWGTMGQLPLG